MGAKLLAMALNVIWVSFLLIGISTAFCKLVIWKDFEPMHQVLLMLLGGRDSEGNKVTSMAEVAATISLGYIGLMSLWLGIMKVGEMGACPEISRRADR